MSKKITTKYECFEEFMIEYSFNKEIKKREKSFYSLTECFDFIKNHKKFDKMTYIKIFGLLSVTKYKEKDWIKCITENIIYFRWIIDEEILQINVYNLQSLIPNYKK